MGEGRERKRRKGRDTWTIVERRAVNKVRKGKNKTRSGNHRARKENDKNMKKEEN